ncbi:MAG: lysophospholipid acyltransferase family protein [Sphingomicrobium sp.]
MIFRIRAVLFVGLFYLMTLMWVLASLFAYMFGQQALQAVVRSWARTNHRLTRFVVGIDSRAIGPIPTGPCLLAVKHEAAYETIEIVRLTGTPVMVMKRELVDIPLFGKVTQLYGVIPVERSAGAKALRMMLAGGKRAIAEGRPIAIFPEGTRVEPNSTPPLRPGFAGLYRAVGLPVVPVAVDSGRVFGKVMPKRSGTITFQFGEMIPAGLGREEIETRVHAAMNALVSAAEAGA